MQTHCVFALILFQNWGSFLHSFTLQELQITCYLYSGKATPIIFKKQNTFLFNESHKNILGSVKKLNNKNKTNLKVYKEQTPTEISMQDCTLNLTKANSSESLLLKLETTVYSLKTLSAEKCKIVVVGF